MKDGCLVSISETEYPGLAFKVLGSKALLDQQGIPSSSVVAIGDSPADIGLFDMAAKSIAINPKSGVERYADYVIHDDLSRAIPILQALME